MKTEPDLTWPRVKALELLKQLFIRQPEEIAIEDIAWLQGAVVIEGPLKGCEARLIFKPGASKATIRVRQDIPEIGRKRFAIAHELGHWMLHRTETQIDLFKIGDVGLSYASSPLEIEANTFASEILMPDYMFQPRCDTGAPNIDVIRKLSTVFNATLTATAVRYVDLCPEACVVVFSEKGKVKWWRNSKNADVWIEPKMDVHPDTYAYDALNNKSTPTSMESVPASAWFPDRESQADQFIKEVSMQIGSYNTVMSLIWLGPTEEDCDDESGE